MTPTPSLRDAARALAEKLVQVHEDPLYIGVWALYAKHGFTYAGPQYDKELAALRLALDAEERRGTAIVLNDYQVSNLRAAIEAARQPGPLAVLDNGDWLGEILQMLPVVGHNPNKSAETMCREAQERADARTKALEADRDRLQLQLDAISGEITEWGSDLPPTDPASPEWSVALDHVRAVLKERDWALDELAALRPAPPAASAGGDGGLAPKTPKEVNDGDRQ